MSRLDRMSPPAAGTRTCVMCDEPLPADAKFCRGCGAPQVARSAPAIEPVAPTSPPSTGRGWVPVVAVVALLAVAAALAVILLKPQPGSAADEEIGGITTQANETLRDLDGAVGAATPGDSASMAALRSTATWAASALADAQIDARALALEYGDEARQLDALRRALHDNEALAQALASQTPVPGLIERRGADATRAAGTLVLADVETGEFVAALRKRDRERAAAAERRLKAQAAAVRQQPAATRYRSHSGIGYQAQIPSGNGWSQPADSQPRPGELFRTSVRGPDGVFLIIDYTPYEPARFGGSYQTTRSVGQTAFGSATEYVFQGGRLPECQRARCVDYIINDPASSTGFGVLAGGPDFAAAKEIARTVMESLTAA